MKAVCPRDASHDRFITCAHVMQDWEVDAEGNWIKTVDESVQTTHGPHQHNIWTCSICGTEAKVED